MAGVDFNNLKSVSDLFPGGIPEWLTEDAQNYLSKLIASKPSHLQPLTATTPGELFPGGKVPDYLSLATYEQNLPFTRNVPEEWAGEILRAAHLYPQNETDREYWRSVIKGGVQAIAMFATQIFVAPYIGQAVGALNTAAKAALASANAVPAASAAPLVTPATPALAPALAPAAPALAPALAPAAPAMSPLIKSALISTTGSLAAQALGGVLGNTGGGTVTGTNQYQAPPWLEGDLIGMWNDYIDHFYGTGGAKSYEQMSTEDIAAQQAATKGYVDTSGQIMDERLAALSGERGGMYQPISFGFGGQPAATFVPRTGRNLADAIAAALEGQAGKQLSYGTTFTPNIAQTSYMDKLQGLLGTLLPQFAKPTETTTGKYPGTSWSELITNALNAGLKTYDIGSRNAALDKYLETIANK